MKYLVVGGTGTISGGIATEALRQGNQVVIINRGNRDYRIPDGVEVVRADINDVNKMHSIVREGKFDIVVDPLVMNVKQLKKHLDFFDGHCKKYVYISSCCAFGGGFTDVVDENHEMLPQSKYGINKKECEEWLKNNRIKSDYLIIRPYITYGDIRIPIPFACRKNPYTVIDRIEKEKPLVCFGIENHRTMHNLMDIRDFSRMVVNIASGDYKNEDYNICGDMVYSWDQAYDILYSTVGKPKHLYYVDREIFKYFDYHLYEDIVYDKDCDGTIYCNKKAKRDSCDEQDHIDLEHGIRDLVHYLRINCSSLPPEDQFDYRCDLLLVNAVANSDDFLNKYIDSLDKVYVDRLKHDWNSYVKTFRFRKVPIIKYVIRVMKRIKRTMI